MSETRTLGAKKVLVISAHPDDEILGLGGTLRRHAQDGAEVHTFIACEGAGMRYDEAHHARVVEQANRAAGILGVARVHFGELPDQRLDTLPLVEVAAKVEALVDSLRPDTVYTHFQGDVNHDHGVLFRAVQVATRPYAAPWVRDVLAYETASSTEWGAPTVQGHFVPEVFVDISQTLEAKIEAFLCYEKEVREAPHPRSPESLRARARTFGSYVGLDAAEPFQVVRSIR
jgi:LmbE family N-acetylglucosaminyl deacetylase